LTEAPLQEENFKLQPAANSHHPNTTKQSYIFCMNVQVLVF